MSQRWSLKIRVLRWMQRQIPWYPGYRESSVIRPKGWAGRVHWWHPDPYRTSRSGSACIPPAPGRTGWHRSEIWHNLPQKPGTFDGWGTLVAWGKTWSGMQLIIWEVYDVVMCLESNEQVHGNHEEHDGQSETWMHSSRFAGPVTNRSFR